MTNVLRRGFRTDNALTAVRATLHMIAWLTGGTKQTPEKTSNNPLAGE